MIEYLPKHLAIVGLLVEVVAKSFSERMRSDRFEIKLLSRTPKYSVGLFAMNRLIGPFPTGD
ncbi:hypothetical protein D3C73_1643050 [compost metagenome]